jgi:hypothetical protein
MTNADPLPAAVVSRKACVSASKIDPPEFVAAGCLLWSEASGGGFWLWRRSAGYGVSIWSRVIPRQSLEWRGSFRRG